MYRRERPRRRDDRRQEPGVERGGVTLVPRGGGRPQQRTLDTVRRRAVRRTGVRCENPKKLEQFMMCRKANNGAEAAVDEDM
ncbi:hypothetical protein NDU88_001963 [Pleurodeles waltl]|uniref:Uncharacterized protein n=1 Tax=Pleurodeles waltl TaxID=8319 RepID=A0AAV7W0Z9_PLEWA|nr:hypothetical protein NDU88_001963 [Pleurodeles waltl]